LYGVDFLINEALTGVTQELWKATPLYQQNDNPCQIYNLFEFCVMPSPVLANLLMENFEQNVLAIITLEINGMVHYNIMEDTFIVWPHQASSLDLFLTHLYSECESIQFTIEKKIIFLDMLVVRNEGGIYLCILITNPH
jgi:hypothetical protein